MPLDQLLEQRREIDARPVSYDDLLLEPITNDGEPMTDWAQVHNDAARFRTVGMVWFQQATGMTNKWLGRYLEDARKFILEKTTWHEMPDRLGHWKTNPSPGQLSSAQRAKPMIFAKCAQVLVTCELALQAQMTNPRQDFRVPVGFTSAEQIYGHMGIFAAVWNIRGFGREYINAAEAAHQTMRSDLVSEAGLTSNYIITDLGEGFCVTREVAEAIYAYASEYLPVIGHHLDRVRSTPGTFLGRKGASKHEELTLVRR